ncbi:GNAT family N-acetyltransferase [Actinospica robiniae]|uniref:GNAT family N-acetyltransferase n=1 Tax=Actinospica robiniae TaxID=304901 RepID=UPI00040C072E|nr:GNAT family N-acetyltransferase [Actinospica robiniae]
MENLEDLIRRWFQGWCASRHLPEAEPADDGLWINCKQPNREFEVFTLHADDDPPSVSRLAAQVLAKSERTWLTAATRHLAQTSEAIEATGLVLLQREEWFMGVDLTEQPLKPLDSEYTSDVKADGSAVAVEIYDRAGELAARGQLGIAGDDAVPDRIETMPGHRRRGLGSVVMGMLAAEALARGAHTGLLIASPDGQQLYSRLGWARIADVVIAGNTVNV